MNRIYSNYGIEVSLLECCVYVDERLFLFTEVDSYDSYGWLGSTLYENTYR